MSLSIYIHLPYCIKKCPFCDFNSFGVGKNFPENEYTDSLLKELKIYEGLIINHDIASVYFGGGTPSLFSPGSIENLIDGINALRTLSNNTEITIEVNPKTADYNKFNNLRQAGINRVSTGMQSFSERKLSLLGRPNNPIDNYKTFNDINRANISNINIDLMYGTPDETMSEWANDLETAGSLLPKHISAYCLTIENGTEFYKRLKNGDLILPDEEILLAFLNYTADYLKSKRFIHYEISNFAIEGYSSVHNRAYWKGEDYIGLGAGAHSHLKSRGKEKYGVRWSNFRTPSKYINNVINGFSPVESYEELSLSQSFQDSVMMGLRLMDGIDINKIKTRFGLDFNYDNMKELFEEGLLSRNNDYISLSGKGMALSNYIISKLVENTCAV